MGRLSPTPKPTTPSFLVLKTPGVRGRIQIGIAEVKKRDETGHLEFLPVVVQGHPDAAVDVAGVKKVGVLLERPLGGQVQDGVLAEAVDQLGALGQAVPEIAAARYRGLVTGQGVAHFEGAAQLGGRGPGDTHHGCRTEGVVHLGGGVTAVHKERPGQERGLGQNAVIQGRPRGLLVVIVEPVDAPGELQGVQLIIPFDLPAVGQFVNGGEVRGVSQVLPACRDPAIAPSVASLRVFPRRKDKLPSGFRARSALKFWS